MVSIALNCILDVALDFAHGEIPHYIGLVFFRMLQRSELV